MKYFLHDSNAFNDEKITELFIEFGYEGLGLYYTILEKLAQQEKPIKTLVLKRQLKVGKRLEKCWSFMESLGIISSNNGDTFNVRLLSYSEKYKIKSEKNAKRISEWREKQTIAENVTHYESVRNTSKVKESKVNRNKVKESKENIIPEFSEFLNYAIEKEPLLDEKSVKLKYESWIENGWKNGNGKEIKNWKSNLLNTIPYIQKNQNGISQQNNSADRLKKQFAERVQKTMGC